MAVAGSLRARAVLAFIAQPGLVAGIVPLLIAWPVSMTAGRMIGLVPFLAGLSLLLWCVRDFAVTGRGTLAPWDPPRALVVTGAYRRSRTRCTWRWA